MARSKDVARKAPPPPKRSSVDPELHVAGKAARKEAPRSTLGAWTASQDRRDPVSILGGPMAVAQVWDRKVPVLSPSLAMPQN